MIIYLEGQTFQHRVMVVRYLNTALYIPDFKVEGVINPGNVYKQSIQALDKLYFSGVKVNYFARDIVSLGYITKLSKLIKGADDELVRLINGLLMRDLDVVRSSLFTRIKPEAEVSFLITEMQYGFYDKLHEEGLIKHRYTLETNNVLHEVNLLQSFLKEILC